MTDDRPILVFDAVTKLYDTVLGVNDINLSLPRGGYGLVGPNGSGKTTLLNLLLGQLRPSLGRVSLFDRNPWGDPMMGRRVGYCPSLDGLYSAVSGYRWLRYLGEMSGLTPSQSKARTEEVLDQVGMRTAMHRPIGTYSQGMRQRIKLSQALLHDPELLVLDEPFNGLDPVARHELIELLKRWLGQGRSLILSSHVLHEVEAVTSTFLLIRGGRLLAVGSAREVHQLLSHVPSDIRVVASRPWILAQALLAEGIAESARIDDDGRSLHVTSKAPRKVYEALPKLVAEHALVIERIDSPDESLQTLFDKLFRMHRGEL